MQHAANAYSKLATTALPPRELEASLLIKAAARLQGIVEDWEARQADLEPALTYNRKLWTVLASAATEQANPLPQAVKNNMAQLAVFVFGQTIQAMIQPGPQKLRPLVTINREIAAGLRSAPPAA